MFEAFSFRRRMGFTLLVQSALIRALWISLLLAVLWAAIQWADAIA